MLRTHLPLMLVAILLGAQTFVESATAAPFLGLYLAPAVGQEQVGTRIHFVIPRGPADEAGFKAGDIIVKVGDQDIDSAQALIELVRGLEPGAEVNVTIQRDDQQLQLTPKLGDDQIGPPRPRPFSRRPMIGIALQQLPDEGGLQIADVMPRSPAEQAGLKRGDVVQMIDGQQVEGYRMLVDYVLSKQAGDEVAVTVLREENLLEVKVTLSAFGPRR